MNITCQSCQTKNNISVYQNDYHCINCHEPLSISFNNMLVLENDITALRKSMTAEMNKFYDSYEGEVNKITKLEKNFELLKSVWETSKKSSKTTPEIVAEVIPNIIPAVVTTKVLNEIPSQIADQEKIKRELEAANRVIQAQEREALFLKIQEKEQQKYKQQQKSKEQKAYAKTQAQEAEKQRLAAINAEPNMVEEVLVEVLVPFSQLRTMTLKVINHYKEQNQLPVFFLVVGGIVALLLGFAFLMQYADSTFSEISKYVFSTSVVAGLIIWGLRLNNKESKFKEFGSAIVGLACALAYLVVYSVTDSPILTVFNNSAIGFILIFLVTVGTSFLSFRYETKVVAVISLLGGAFAPMYIDSINITIFYFIYLFVLCITAIFVGRAIKWKIMDTLSFVVASVAISIIFYQKEPLIPIVQYTMVFLAFAYLFFYVAIFERNFIPKETLVSKNIVMLIGSAGFLVVNLFYLYSNLKYIGNTPFDLRTLGTIHLANATVFVLGFAIFRKKLSNNMATLFFVLSGVFLGFAFPLLLERDVSGIFWGLEAVALVYCGFLFNLPLVRKEGYFGLFLAAVKIAFSLNLIIDNWEVVLWTDAYIQLVGFVGVLVILIAFFKHFKIKLVDIEANLSIFLYQTAAFLLLVSIWTGVYFYMREKTYILGVLGLYSYIFWGHKVKSFFIEVLGLAHLVLIGYGAYLSILEVNSAVFAFQTLFGKIAIVEIFVSLWLLQFMYEKTAPKYDPKAPENIGQNMLTEPPTMSLVKLFRELFYLLVPVLLLFSVNRLHPVYLPVAIWASVVINYILNLFVKRKAMTFELYGLVALGTYWLLVLPTEIRISAMSIAGGIVALAGVFFHAKGYVYDKYSIAKENHLFTYLFYFIGLCTFLVFIGLNGDITNINNAANSINGDIQNANFNAFAVYTSALFVVSLYFFVLVYVSKDKFVPLQNNHSLAFRVGYVALLLGIILKAFAFSQTANEMVIFDVDTAIWLALMLASVGVLIAIVHSRGTAYPHKEEGIWIFDMVLMNFFITATYALIIASISPTWLGVLLSVVIIIHAMALLFSSTIKRLSFYLRLSIFYFVGVILKLFLNDMASFTIVQKVIVFMVIGAIMLIGAFLFMKIKNNADEKEA